MMTKTVTICLLLSVCWLPLVNASRNTFSTSASASSVTKEVKSKYAMKLCGKDFIQAWEKICKLKQLKSSFKDAQGRTKRSSLAGKNRS